MDAARTRRAAVMGALGLCWYAMPDVVRSRAARTALKTALLAGAATAVATSRDTTSGREEPETAVPRPDVDDAVTPPPLGTRLGLAVGVAILVGSIVIDVRTERALFARAERRRAAGARAAHLRHGIIAGVLLATGTLLDVD